MSGSASSLSSYVQTAYRKTVKIGPLSLSPAIFLAPLAGYTDRAFRSVAIEEGAGLTYSEMVSAEGLSRGSEKTEELLSRARGEELFAIQLFGSNPDAFARSALPLMKYSPTLVDLNCGCPVPKVVKTGAGSALLKNPALIGEIVKVLKRETGLPVTVKIRTGWDFDSINYLETAEEAFKAGADALTLHARTRSQGYSGKADREAIRILKEHFPEETILASGDIFSSLDADAVFAETGVDGVMAARGAIGNPFIFRKNGDAEVPLSERKEVFMKHLTLAAEYEGEEKACREMRKSAPSYFKGIPGSSAMRASLSKAQTIKDYTSSLLFLTT